MFSALVEEAQKMFLSVVENAEMIFKGWLKGSKYCCIFDRKGFIAVVAAGCVRVCRLRFGG